MLWLILPILLLGLSFSHFLQRTAITESSEIQAGSLALMERTGAVFVMVSFVVGGISREYQEKGMEFFLALPMGRTSYLFGKLLGYACCSLLLAILFTLPFFLSNSPVSASIWGISLFLELALMSCVSLFFSISLTQMPLALAAVSGFYLLSRSMGAIMLIMKGPLAVHGFLEDIADRAISLVSFVLPSLDDFTRTGWILYQETKWQVLLPVLVQTAIYLLLISAAALFDFERREI